MNKYVTDISCFFEALGMPKPVAEFRFHPVRRWRIDYTWPDVQLAVEIEGGAFTNGRHTRGKGFIADMEKYNAMVEMGWILLRYTPTDINYQQIKKVWSNLKKI